MDNTPDWDSLSDTPPPSRMDAVVSTLTAQATQQAAAGGDPDQIEADLKRKVQAAQDNVYGAKSEKIATPDWDSLSDTPPVNFGNVQGASSTAQEPEPDVFSEGAAQAASRADPSHEAAKVGDMLASTAQSYTPLGLVPMVAGGLAGLDELTGRDQDVAGRVQKAADSLTYEPRTEEGRKFQEAIQTPFRKLSEVGRSGGEFVQEHQDELRRAGLATGNPGLLALSLNPEVGATIAETATLGAPFALGGKRAGDVAPHEAAAANVKAIADHVAAAQPSAQEALNAGATMAQEHIHAREVPTDQGGVPEAGTEPQSGGEGGGADLQQPAQAGAEASHEEGLNVDQNLQPSPRGAVALPEEAQVEKGQAQGEVAQKPHFTGPEVAERLRAPPEAAPEPAEAQLFDPARYQELRNKAERTPEEQSEYTKLVETRSETADVNGEHIPGVLNAVGRAQLEASGQMKPFRVKTDIDDFKDINDTLGHDVGDEALRMKAEAMRDAFGPGNSWREGGDEFGAHADTPEEAHAKMAKVREALSGATLQHVDDAGNVLTEKPIKVSYGVGEGENPKLAAKAADNALYADKTARTAAGERNGRRATDAEPGADVGPGVGGLREVAGRDQVPDREQAQVAVAEPPAQTEAAKAPPQKPAETTLAEPRDTSVRNAATAVDRATLGMEPLTEAEHKEWGKSKAEAAQRIAEDHEYPQKLAREVLKSKRPITDAETMALGAERLRLQAQHAAITREIVRAMDAGDHVAEVQARTHKAKIDDELDVNHHAAQRGGTELARAMAARNAQMVDDYSAAHLQVRARAAYRGELPPGTEGRLNSLAEKIQAQEREIAQLHEAQERGAQRKAVKEQDVLQRQIAQMEAKLAKRLEACPI